MSTQQSPPFYRRQFGRRLRDLRESVRMAPGEVCARLEISPARLSRLENGQTAPDMLVVKALLDLYGIPVNDWEPYLEEARDARKKAWWQSYGLSANGYTALETAANSVSEFALAYLPGLLQTEAYARAALFEDLRRRTPIQLDNQIAVRLRRQQRLLDPENFSLSVVIDETALLRPVVPTDLMHEQLTHLLEVAEWPNVELQVLPVAGGAHVGMNGAFVVLGFPDVSEGDIAYVEHVAGALQLEREEQVRACKLSYDRLRTKALDPAESAEMIRRLLS